MKTQRTNTIGMVVSDLSNPFYFQVLDVFTQEVARAGFRVVIWNTARGSQDDALKAIRERAVDGVAFTTATRETAELKAAVERNSPIVLINRSVEGIDCDQVTGSNRTGGALVADYFVAHGKTHVALISGLVSTSTAQERSEGFLLRMEKLGHPVPSSLQLNAHYSHDKCVTVTQALLDMPLPPEAIFCANDFMAFGALDALRANGLSAPVDCWIVGYDDVAPAAWSSLDLTTVHQPTAKMARHGARLLLSRIADPDRVVEHRVFPCRLVVRGSTGHAPV